MVLKFDPTCFAFLDVGVICPSTGNAAALFVGRNHKRSCHLLF